MIFPIYWRQWKYHGLYFAQLDDYRDTFNHAATRSPPSWNQSRTWREDAKLVGAVGAENQTNKQHHKRKTTRRPRQTAAIKYIRRWLETRLLSFICDKFIIYNHTFQSNAYRCTLTNYVNWYRLNTTHLIMTVSRYVICNNARHRLAWMWGGERKIIIIIIKTYK